MALQPTARIGFYTTLALVIGSQIGSGVFMLPSNLAQYGFLSIIGWCLSGLGAVFLALVFSRLSLSITNSGGPHAYVKQAFGIKPAFFVAWVYWLVSWVSSIAVVISAAGYFLSIFGSSHTQFDVFAIEVLIITFVTYLNVRGIKFAGISEVILTSFKVIPLTVIPLAGLFFIDSTNFEVVNSVSSNLFGDLNHILLVTFWGFIGLECATTTAGIVKNPQRTIPKAVVIGTILVMLVYVLNSVSIIGVVDPAVLTSSQAPYVDATAAIFGGNWGIAIALIASIACVGTLNAWVLISGQIAKSATDEGIFPSILGKTNSNGSPYVSIIIASVISVVLMGFTLSANIVEQFIYIIDVSVTAFLFIYLFGVFSYIALWKKGVVSVSVPYMVLTSFVSMAFCIWIIWHTDLLTLTLTLCFFLTGVPAYFYMFTRKKQAANVQEVICDKT